MAWDGSSDPGTQVGIQCLSPSLTRAFDQDVEAVELLLTICKRNTLSRREGASG